MVCETMMSCSFAIPFGFVIRLKSKGKRSMCVRKEKGKIVTLSLA